ncbi:MAG: hypothetical protein NVS3B26_02460 [Mycobacteriales bacterium]
MPRPTLHLVRHGQSEWNRRGLLQGQRYDVPLTPLGFTHAARAAQVLGTSGAQVVLTSDLLRAVQTAEVIARRLGVPLEQRAELREQSVGIYEGQPSRKVWAETDPEDWGRPSWYPPGGESTAQVARRLRVVLADAAAREADVVLVTHGDTARIAAGLLRGHGVDDIPWLMLGNGEVLSLPVPDRAPSAP